MEDISSFTRDKRQRTRVSSPEKVERRTYNPDRKPFDGERKPYDGERKPFDGERKSFEHRDARSEHRPFDGERRTFERRDERGERRTFDGERKPYERRDDRGERRSFGGERKPFERRPYDGERKSFDGERRSFNPNFTRENRPQREDDRGERRPYNSDRKPFERRPFDGERRPFERRDDRGERRTFDGERKPFEHRDNRGERRTFDGERRPYERRDDRGEHRSFDGERKPFQRREYNNGEAKAQGERRFKPKYPPNRMGMGATSPRPQYDSTNYPKFEPHKIEETVRLNRYISMSGLCSRREADELITSGQVSVDGTIITELGTKIALTAEVKINDKTIENEKKVYLVLNKPKGYVTSLEDPHAEKTVMELIKGGCTERVYPVGRLDKNSLGVLLFTNDGDLAKQLTHPSHAKKKVYQVTLDKPISKSDMERIVEGIELEDGEIHADEISWVGTSKAEVGIEIHSGRNRVVRRIFEYLGYTVKKLDRVYFAGLTKAKLKRGEWRFLTPKEVERLRSGRYE